MFDVESADDKKGVVLENLQPNKGYYTLSNESFPISFVYGVEPDDSSSS